MKPSIFIGLAAAVTALPLLAAAAGPQSVAEVGAKPEYKFRTSPTNAMGIKSLEDLKGKPVLIEFWGTK